VHMSFLQLVVLMKSCSVGMRVKTGLETIKKEIEATS